MSYSFRNRTRQLTGKAKQRAKATNSPSLQALTAAALVLPGLMLSAGNVVADDDAVDFQYGHYEETKRNLFTVPNNLQPINVDTIHGGTSLTLTDRTRFGFSYTQDTWSGATPIAVAPLVANSNRPIKVNSPTGLVTVGASPMITGQVTLNKNYQPMQTNPQTGKVTGQNSQVVDTMAYASPETRKQGNFELGYQWDEAELDGGAGISVEPDYQSRFANLNGRLDFNQKQTSLNLGLSYTNSQISAILDHDAAPYITKTAYLNDIQTHGSEQILYNNRQDWATTLNLTQVVNKDATFQANIGYTRSSGYLANPYKVESVIFVDPKQQSASATTLNGNMQALMEQRPNERNLVSLGTQYIQHIGVLGLDAALHLDYRFSHDDWGINSHAFEVEWGQPVGWGWSITPRVRYYSQDAAYFFQPYLISKQAYKTTTLGPNGQPVTTSFNPSLLPSYFSSDQRLSGFGTLSGGVTVSTQFAKGINLEAGFEYYTHQGALKLGGGGEGNYADFNYWVANAAFSLDFSALGSGSTDHSDHDHMDHSQHSAHVPSGVLIGHMMKKANEAMVGYRFMYSRDAGNMLRGSTPVGNRTLINNGCAGNTCYSSPTDMNMFMHMIDIMYAPTDWLNLMLMPQFMDMQMDMQALPGAPLPPTNTHVHTGSIDTGGVGDVGLYALVSLVDTPVHHAHLGLGISAPTGNVGLQLRRMHQTDAGFVHYGMMLGSGTWDFKPSLTYTGQMDDWHWGAQLSGIQRLQNSNSSGFALGNEFESTAWGGYNLTDWLSTTVRCLYTLQGSIQGEYNSLHPITSPPDFPSNYGGRYVDMGFGLTAMVTGGALKGNVLGVEYLQPVSTNVNGYQLDRVGAVAATWSFSFDL